jgi:hypothetical protein
MVEKYFKPAGLEIEFEWIVFKIVRSVQQNCDLSFRSHYIKHDP